MFQNEFFVLQLTPFTQTLGCSLADYWARAFSGTFFLQFMVKCDFGLTLSHISRVSAGFTDRSDITHNASRPSRPLSKSAIIEMKFDQSGVYGTPANSYNLVIQVKYLKLPYNSSVPFIISTLDSYLEISCAVNTAWVLRRDETMVGRSSGYLPNYGAVCPVHCTGQAPGPMWIGNTPQIHAAHVHI